MTKINVGKHVLNCDSIERVDFKELLGGKKAHIFYSDPPWGDGAMKYWVTLNKKDTGIAYEPMTYGRLLEVLVRIVKENVDGYVFIETGKRWEEQTRIALESFAYNVRVHNTFYKCGTKFNPCVLFSCSTRPELFFVDVLDGLYGLAQVKRAIKSVAVPNTILLDPMCGMGYSARTAKEYDMIFVGNEFNAKRLLKTKEKLL